jgi:phenylacetate-CoA ligase
MYRWLVWNYAFPLHERLKGHPTVRILNEMETADRLSAVELEQLQKEKLRKFIEYCYAHVPYIRARMKGAGLGPPDIRTAADLSRLPVMTKSDVRRDRAGLRSQVAGQLGSFSSGGSTGEPLVFDISKERIASRVACRQRVSRWWGTSVGDSELALWGSPLELTRQDWVRGMRDRLMATQLLSAYELNEATISRYLDVLEKRRFRQIFAYPSAIYLLCRHAQKQGRNLRALGTKVIFVTSEVLYSYQRDLITQTLGCPVANGYGGRDSGFIAHECPQGGMHLMADAIIAEIVDAQGRPVPTGESGEIVVTDLYSKESPFVRYVTGDVGALSNKLCPCGRPLPLLERLEGRSNDSIVTSDNRIMHGQSVVSLLMEVEGIEQFRICQKRVDYFHVQIVRNERFQVESEERIRKRWCDRLRSKVDLRFEYVPKISSERSGKFRHIISEIPVGQVARQTAKNHSPNQLGSA